MCVCVISVCVCVCVCVCQIEQARAELLQERAARHELECDKIRLERQVNDFTHIYEYKRHLVYIYIII